MNADRARHSHVILLHYPILNRKGEVVTTAVTNLDIHDISRACATYGISSYHIVTPIKLQQDLVRKILGHWKEGWGKTNNPVRAEAFVTTHIASSLEEAASSIAAMEGTPPLLVGTSARTMDIGAFSFADLRENDRPVALVFGTGWGIAPQAKSAFDGFLPPVRGPVEYNHLSVRSAVSIVLDRYLGLREE